MKIHQMAVILVVVSSLTGCASYFNHAPNAGELGIGLSASSSVTYDVIGDAKGTASGQLCCGIIPIGLNNKFGAVGAGAPLIRPQDQFLSEAYYNAIQSVPSADALVAPRYEMTLSGFPIIDVSVTVRGKAIRINNSKQ